MSEQRCCNDCGSTWDDTGMSYECPYCGSDDTFIIPDDDESEEE